MPKKYNQRMTCRFTVAGNNTKLRDALCSQVLINGDVKVAKKLADRVSVLSYRTKHDLMTQDEADDDVYFILSGSVSIMVNGREIARREAGEHVGEMVLLDTTARRSATVRTLEPTVVAKISEHKFTVIANEHPLLWRRIALVLAKRLRERNKYHQTPRSEPTIFIGSSSEGLPAAEAIHKYLSRHPCVPNLWTKGVFECAKTTIEDLTRLTTEMDFAIIALSPDDVTTSRGAKKYSPRDNVIFELGLFMGALSRERTYIVAPKNMKIKVPTDLLGVTLLTYQNSRGKNITTNLASVKKELLRLIRKYGPM